MLEPCGCTSDPLGDIARYASWSGPRRAGRRSCWCRRGRAVVPGDQQPRKRRPSLCARRSWRRRWRSWGRLRRVSTRPTCARARRTWCPGAWRSTCPVARAGAVDARRLRRDQGRRLRRGRPGARRAKLGVKARGSDRGRAARGRTAAQGGRGADRRAGPDRQAARAPAGARSGRPISSCSGARSGRAARAPSGSGRGFMVAAADELQQVGRIDIVWRGAGPLADAGGPEASGAPTGRDRSGGRAPRRAAQELGRKTAGDAAFIAGKRASGRRCSRSARRSTSSGERPSIGKLLHESARSRCDAACPEAARSRRTCDGWTRRSPRRT